MKPIVNQISRRELARESFRMPLLGVSFHWWRSSRAVLTRDDYSNLSVLGRQRDSSTPDNDRRMLVA